MATNPISRGSMGDADSAGGLLGRLLEDATALLRNEIALAKCELQQAAGTIKRSVAAMAFAAAVLIAGLVTLIAAGVLALAQVVAPWLAALSDGVLLALIGIVMIGAARTACAARRLAWIRRK